MAAIKQHFFALPFLNCFGLWKPLEIFIDREHVIDLTVLKGSFNELEILGKTKQLKVHIDQKDQKSDE